MLREKYIPRYTYADYSLWEGDWELIDGYPHAMAPSPFGAHQRVQMEFSIAIGIELKKKSCGCEAFAELDWIIDNNNVLRPDLMIACGERVDKHLEYAPVWIVEILSPSSGMRDQIIKKEVYALQGVRYYLIADPDKKTVIMYELKNGEYILKTDPTFELTDHCSISLDTDAIINS